MSVANLPSGKSMRNSSRTKGGTENALDNLRDSLDPVVGRHGFELHAWRFHSPASGNSAGDVDY
jgi:hypothetical protein